MLDDGVVPGGDVLRADGARLGPEIAKLHLLVAHHAGVRRAAGFVFAGEVVDDQLLKLVRLIHHVVRDAQRVRDAARIGDRLRPAAFILGAGEAILRPDLHRHAHDIVTLLLQKIPGDAGIHASAHAQQDAGTRFGGGRRNRISHRTGRMYSICRGKR